MNKAWLAEGFSYPARMAMKRPRLFVLVAVWCCLALVMQASYLTRPARAYQAAGEPVPVFWSFAPLAAVVFIVWQMVGLVRLRRFHRWFAVVFFGWWGVCLAWNANILLRRPGVKVLASIVLFSALVALNILSAWYLSRRTFREFAVQFVAEQDKERHSRMMQEASQKKMLDDIRS